LPVQQVGEAGQVEWLRVSQPLQLQLLPFREHRRAGCPPHGEGGLLDAVRIVLGERPLLEGGHLLGEKRSGVGDCLVEDPGHPVVEGGR
jgi:hypothetical protein